MNNESHYYRPRGPGLWNHRTIRYSRESNLRDQLIGHELKLPPLLNRAIRTKHTDKFVISVCSGKRIESSICGTVCSLGKATVGTVS